MHRGHSHRIFATVSRAILLISNLIVGCCGATSVPAWGFGPPSNVVADVIPDLRKYELRRIGIIALVNRSGTPDAGVRVANFFFQELDAHRRFELTPPLLLGGDGISLHPHGPGGARGGTP